MAAKNTFRSAEQAPPKKKIKWKYQIDWKKIIPDKRSLTSPSSPIDYVPQVMFLTLLGIFYIANNYVNERLLTDILRLEKEVNILRADYTTLKYEFVNASKKDEIEKKVEGLGLFESDNPAYLLEKK